MDIQQENGQRAPEGSTKAVAIIMRSKNEQPYTEQTLESLYRQSFTDFTLYNVDSGSTDGTLEAVRHFNPTPENVHEIAPEDYLPGPVLNTMIRRTAEPVVVLLNADCVPTTDDWLGHLVRGVIEGEADAVTARQVARGDAYFVVRYDLDRAYGDRDIEKKKDHFFSAAACAFKRSLWEQEAFPEKGWGEDFVWAVKSKENGAIFDIALDAVVEHSHNYTLKVLYRREYGHGIVHYQMLKSRPSLLGQSFTCLKHIVRDILYAVRKGKFMTIPYNVVYRATFHWAHYRGRRTAFRGGGFSKEFFRE